MSGQDGKDIRPGLSVRIVLKQDQRTRNIPVMALSGHVLAGNAEQARQAGADEFVAKPCLPQDLEDRIRRMLKPSKSKSQP